MILEDIINIEDLKDLYLCKKYSARKIAEIVGCDRSRIKALLSKYSICKGKQKFIISQNIINNIVNDYIKCKSMLLLAKKYKTTSYNIRKILNQNNIKVRGENVRTIEIGESFGNLVVTGINKRTKYRIIKYNCICSCGKECFIFSHKLLSGHKKSCGCLKFVSGQNHKDWKGCGDICGNFWSSIRGGARSRNLDFKITIEQAWNLFLEQNRKCKLTGQSLIMPPSNSQKRNINEPYASLDRIDSSKGYTIDNIQWVHKDINIMKMDFDLYYFKQLCNMVTNNG